jgi:tetratricopeptide (TPR) repeat protein
MGEFEAEEKEAKELVERFKSMMDSGSSVFFDSEEMEIIIDELMRQMDVPMASEAIEYAIRLYPTDSFFRILRAKKMMMQMEFDKAEEELDDIETTFPPTPELYMEKVMLARMTGSNIDAFRLLNKALKLDEDDPEVHFLLAYEYLKKKDVTNALQHTIFALREDEVFDEQLFGFSFLLEDNKQYEDGIAFYGKLTEEFPLLPGCWFGLGLSYSWNKEYDKAIDAYQYVLSIDEKTSTAYYNMANCYFELSDFQNALANYQQAYDMDPEDYNSVTCIGDCYSSLNQPEKAIEYFQKALSMNPTQGDALLGLAYLLKEEGHLGDAQTAIETAFSHNPQSFRLLFEVLPYYSEEEQTQKLQEFFTTTLNQVENKEDFFRFFVQYCCDNELYDYGIEVLETHTDDDIITDMIAYYLAALHFLNHNINKGCEYLANALLINFDGLQEFLSIDPILETFSEVNELIELYK